MNCPQKTLCKSAKTQLNNKVNQNCMSWSNRQLEDLRKSQSRLFQIQQQEIANRILSRQDNAIAFYQITPKDELPKSLQKLGFQTLNTKQNITGNIVKIHKRQKLSAKQQTIRKHLKEDGQIMLLSQIYNYLDDPLQSQKLKEKNLKLELIPLGNVMNQLDEWQKLFAKKAAHETRFSKLRIATSQLEDRRNSGHKKQLIVKKFKIGSDYKTQVEKSLQVISYSHTNQSNLMTRYLLIQNSSKMLKKQLQQMKQIVEKQIQQKMKKLTQSRKQHHRFYEEKLKLQIKEQQLDEQLTKQQGLNNIYGYHNMNQNNVKMVFGEIKNQIQKNETKILRIKKNIQFLEDQAFKNQQQLKNIKLAEVAYYKTSLKQGIDCRQSGLVWIIKNLGIQQEDFNNIEFPQYLDKKSKVYLITKTTNQNELQKILQQKRQFVKQIGRQTQQNLQRRRSSISLARKSSIKLDKIFPKLDNYDPIKQLNYVQGDNDIPKRYTRSMKKITALRQQYLKNQNLLKLTQQRGGLKFGYDLNGLTGRQIYNVISEKIKKVDFSKLKKQKAYDKNDKIYAYQAILRKIQDLHMQIQEQDIQHEAHLLLQYKDQKQLFLTLAAACFGIKRAYSLIIKNFSWKNTV